MAVIENTIELALSRLRRAAGFKADACDAKSLATDLDACLNPNRFYREIINQACDPERCAVPGGPRLLQSGGMIFDDVRSSQAVAVAVGALETFSKLHPEWAEPSVYQADLSRDPSALWEHRQPIIEWARDCSLRHADLPGSMYHVSNMDGAKIGDPGALLGDFILKASQVGAKDPGVYCAPYADITYAGGDSKRVTVDVPVIFEIHPDSECLAYAVKHGRISYQPVEITTRYRHCSGFTSYEFVDISSADVPIAFRHLDRNQYKTALLVRGGTVVTSASRHRDQARNL